MQKFFRILGIINTIGMVIALLGATFGLVAASVALEDANQARVTRRVLCPNALDVRVQQRSVGMPSSKVQPFGFQFQLECVFASGIKRFSSDEVFWAFARVVLERGALWSAGVLLGLWLWSTRFRRRKAIQSI